MTESKSESESEQAAAENGKSVKPSAKAVKASKPKRARKSGKAGRAGKKTSPGARARASREKLAEMAGNGPAKSLIGHGGAHARAREKEILERAARVDPSDKFARLMCIVELMRPGVDLYETGVTPAVLSGAWGLGHTTVENDASEASKIIRAVTDPTSAASTFWAVAIEQLSATRQHLEKIAKLADKVEIETAMDVKMISEALGRCSDSIDRAAQTYGKASGAIQAGTSVSVTLKIDSGDGQKLEGTKEQFAAAWMKLNQEWHAAVVAAVGDQGAEAIRARVVETMRVKYLGAGE